MNTISSKDNSLIKELKKLKDKKIRSARKEFLIEGFRFVEEALKSNFTVKTLIIDSSLQDQLDFYNIRKYINNINTIFVTKEIINLLSSTKTPQGILALVEDKVIKLSNKDGFYILCDKVQDPGNLGTIIRTAHASGSLGVILTKGTVDVYNDKTLRSTMGSLFHVPIFYDDNFELIKSLKEKGFKLYSSSLDTNSSLYDLNLVQNCIIAVGNEGNGISNSIIDLSDTLFKIPMHGNAESLNVAVATSVIAFEIVRQKLI